MAKKQEAVNQSKAMRETLTHLGVDEKRPAVEAYLMEHYKFKPKNYYVLRSNARKALGIESNSEKAESKSTASAAAPPSGMETLTLLQQLAKRVGGMKELSKIVELLK